MLRTGFRWFGAFLALALLVGVSLAGWRVGWRMPKFSTMTGWPTTTADDWCAAHAVPESICVECKKVAAGTKVSGHGWCKTHGVHECPLCHPEVAQVNEMPVDAPDLVAQYASAEGFGERVGNNRKCTLHHRQLQFVSSEAVREAGLRVEPVGLGPVIETVRAPGEVTHDLASVSRVASRLAGTVLRVERRVGDRVKSGDLLAVIDAPAAGKARAELARCALKVETETKTLAGLRSIAETLPERRLRDAKAALDEAIIAKVAAEQALANLGLSADGIGLRLLAPRDGVVLKREVASGESVEPGRVLFVLAEPERLLLTLHVKQEDAAKLRPDLPVRFASDDRATATGAIAWIAPELDERTRTVPVRVKLHAINGLRAGVFGSGEVVLREVAEAVLVPAEAVHWEGCCHVVFVRDRDYEVSSSKVFHVRKVQPGAIDASGTEILAGLLPGEVIATAGSGLLRGELLRNNLGAG